MQGKYENVAIRGIVSALPVKVEDNSIYYELLGEKRVKKQARMTGVKKRYINEFEQTTADLCLEAAKDLLVNCKWTKEEIRVMVLVTQNPTVNNPATSFILQEQLGLSKDCMVFDVNLGCSGFVSGLHIVASLLQSLGNGAKGLVLAGDIMRNPLHYPEQMTPEDLADEMLFGSCGTATAVELVEDYPIYFEEVSDGTKYDVIFRDFNKNTVMDGEQVFSFAINEVTGIINNFFKTSPVPKDMIDFYVLHQAQKFMLVNMADICGFDMEKMLLSLENYGNTSSASIPLSICANKEMWNENDTNNIFMCGFGVGLACAIAIAKLDGNTYTNIIHTEEHQKIRGI